MGVFLIRELVIIFTFLLDDEVTSSIKINDVSDLLKRKLLK